MLLQSLYRAGEGGGMAVVPLHLVSFSTQMHVFVPVPFRSTNKQFQPRSYLAAGNRIASLRWEFILVNSCELYT
jgi:hypothetical protein